MGTNPMDQETSEQIKDRLSNLQGAPRCHARTRRGTPCQSPAVKDRKRCRLQGGATGLGAPAGERNGAYKHGGWTEGALRLRANARKLLKGLRRPFN